MAPGSWRSRRQHNSAARNFTRYNASMSHSQGRLTAREALISPRFRTLLGERFRNQQYECLLALYFGADQELVAEEVFTSFLEDRVHLPSTLLIKSACRCSARFLVIAHNHPKGPAVPSHSDIASTSELARIALRAGLVVAEHLIVGAEGIFSMQRARLVA